MEIYENPSEHYAAVRQLRESDSDRERSRSCASSSGTGSSRASRGVTTHGAGSDSAAASTGPPVNYYGYGTDDYEASYSDYEAEGSLQPYNRGQSWGVGEEADNKTQGQQH